MFEEIMVWLPLESLMRFNDFSAQSTGRDDDADNDCIPCDIKDLISLDDELNLYVNAVSHCNGIICLFVCHLYLIILSNPARGEYKCVQKSCLVDGIELLGVRLATIQRTNDYKVIAIKSPTQAFSHCKAKVFTTSTNSWRDVTVTIEIDYFPTPTEHQVVYSKEFVVGIIGIWM
ncbi:hypothetical protein PanWU01x14_331950 [Parasponia andersonii]|uniref:F-box associated beta-propeller type 1 domain-containing protein n=1 Tax=Parasponia andersonii TaxID=3476 RepID=A0A2P5AHG3_PARAD|nr:hypothetical protein PanWU01x14_331950 [Parasponia andersonii]